MNKNLSKMDLKDLGNYINELESELKQAKKYGLVWDKENTPEQIVIDCEKKIPVLIENGEKNVLNGEINNLLIEGDNFHSSLSDNVKAT